MIPKETYLEYKLFPPFFKVNENIYIDELQYMREYKDRK